MSILQDLVRKFYPRVFAYLTEEVEENERQLEEPLLEQEEPLLEQEEPLLEAGGGRRRAVDILSASPLLLHDRRGFGGVLRCVKARRAHFPHPIPADEVRTLYH